MSGAGAGPGAGLTPPPSSFPCQSHSSVPGSKKQGWSAENGTSSVLHVVSVLASMPPRDRPRWLWLENVASVCNRATETGEEEGQARDASAVALCEAVRDVLGHPFVTRPLGADQSGNPSMGRKR